jgi:hypothetical protein
LQLNKDTDIEPCGVRGGERKRVRRSPFAALAVPVFLAVPALSTAPAQTAGPESTREPIAESVSPGENAPRSVAEGPATRALPLLAATLDPDLTPLRADGHRSGAPYEPGLAPFELSLDGVAIPYAVTALTVLPGTEVALTMPAVAEGTGYAFQFAAGELAATTPEGWMWRAPSEPGIHALRVGRPDTDAAVHVNVVVLHPAEHISDGRLHGYRIGRYQTRPLRGNPAYLAPNGFAEVPAHAEDILVSPHFTLGQFLCKQPGDPRFLALSMPLVHKLEAVLAKANQRGIETSTFHVMSGFRTPWYNASIGNKTVYSRHLWGDAADIFVDVNGDSDMDDLNGDGRSDHRDARVLADLVEEVERSGGPGIEPGGIGLYRRASHRGPFVHVDARGYAARW